MAMPTILIADDDARLLRMLQRTLTYEAMSVVTASNGLEALPLAQSSKPDLMIVDWMMPGMDGVALIRRLRDEGDDTLVLMLTARDTVENRVYGLEAGADDYLVKPFAPEELVARVRALLRRRTEHAENKVLQYADVLLDPAAHEASRGGKPLHLTLTEFNLLHLLMRNPRQVLERGQIMQQVWGYDFGGNDNVLEIYIGYLRRKLEADGAARLIQTVRGVGYMLREE